MIDKDFLNKIILKVKEDQKYLNFYNDYLKAYLELDINETLMIISNNIFKNVDEYILKKIRNNAVSTLRIYKNRYKIPKDYKGCILYYENIKYFKPKILKTIFDNESKIRLLNAYNECIKEYKVKNRSSKLASLMTMATATEINTSFDINDTIKFNNAETNKNEIILKSNELYTRQDINYIPTYRFNDEQDYKDLLTNLKEHPNVKFLKNGKTYIMGKSMDIRDIAIMDFLQEEYSKNLIKREIFMDFSIKNDILPKIYNAKTKHNEILTENRLNKLSHMSFSIKLNNIVSTDNTIVNYDNSLLSDDEYEVLHLFTSKFYNDDKGDRRCKIYLSGMIQEDLINHNVYSINENKLNMLKNKYAIAISMSLLIDRYNSVNANSYKRFYGYEDLKKICRFSYKTKKKENIQNLKDALEHLKENNFIIKNYEIDLRYYYAKIEYIELDYFELKHFNLNTSDIEINI